MKKIKKYYNNYIYSPNLIRYLKIDENSITLQILDCLGHATAPVFPPVIMVWVLFMWNDIIGRQSALIVLVISILIWVLVTCILIHEHKLFNNPRKFDKDEKHIENNKSSIIHLGDNSSNSSKPTKNKHEKSYK